MTDETGCVEKTTTCAVCGFASQSNYFHLTAGLGATAPKTYDLCSWECIIRKISALASRQCTSIHIKRIGGIDNNGNKN
jgi:hypothetical protein